MTVDVAGAVLSGLSARYRRTQALPQYRLQPDLFLTRVLGIAPESLYWSLNPGYTDHHWDGTPDPLVAMLMGLAHGLDVGVESGTGTGKSYTAAAAILWFLASWEGARVFTFAPKEDQLRLYIWMELRKMWPRFAKAFPSAELTDLRVRMLPSSDEWGAWGYAVGVRAGETVATKAAGMHAPHMLIVTEETPGIAPAVMEAHANTCTGDHNLRLALGNPDSQQDTLHQFCVRPKVKHIRVSALDHPNVVTGREIVPGAVGQKSVEARRAEYGEGARLYESRIRGVSPAESADALILAAWVDQAIARSSDPAVNRDGKALGVDVANSEAGDEAAISRWTGAVCYEVVSFPCPDANLLGNAVVTEARASGVPPSRVGVDSVGVGAGCVNEGKRLGFLMRDLNSGGRAWQTMDEGTDVEPGKRAVLNVERFQNLRSQMWWQLRDDLQHGRIALPDDKELKNDLLVPRWWPSNGKIVIEPKEEIKKNLPGGRSPNKGDAVCYGNWVRNRVPVVIEEEFRAFSPEALAADVEKRRIFTEIKKRRSKIKKRGIDEWFM